MMRKGIVSLTLLMVMMMLAGCGEASYDKQGQLYDVYRLGVESGALETSYDEWAESAGIDPEAELGSMEFNVSSTHIQWRMEGEGTWNDLIAVSDFEYDGDQDVEIRVHEGTLQWRLASDPVWTRIGWELADHHVVIFEDGNGTTIDVQMVASGENAEAPEDFDGSTDYRQFTGWDGSTESIEEDSVFKAEYTAQTHTVTYEMKDSPEVDDETYAYGEKLTPPMDLEHNGMVLEGWYTDEALTDHLDHDTMPANDLTLHPKWKVGDSITIGVDSDRMGAALVEKWNEDHPEYEDMIQFRNYGSVNNNQSGAQGIGFQEGDAPDVALVIGSGILGNEGSLLRLNEDLKALGAAETHEAAFESVNQLDYFYMPAFHDGMVFSWNETVLEDLGIDTTDANGDGLPESIDTWEKIFAIAEDWPADDRPEIDVPENDESYTMYEMFPLSLDEVWSGYSSLTAGGWQLFAEGGRDQPGFDSDEFEEGLGFIEEFSQTNMSVDETGSQKAAGEMGWRWDDYLDGAYPMSLVGTWQDIDGAEETTGFDFRFSQMPTYEGEDLHPFTKTKGFVINEHTDNKDLSIKVLEWLYTQGTMTVMIENSNYIPALQETSDIQPGFDSRNKEEFALALHHNHLEIVGTLTNNPDVNAMDVLYNTNLNDYFTDLWDGDITPSEARESIADDAEAWIKQNNQ